VAPPPAPGPVGGGLAEARTDRIVEDVLDHRLEVVLVLDNPGAEPRAEDVAHAGVLVVVRLGVATVQELHPRREVLAGALDDGVIVRVEEAEGVHSPPEPPDDDAEQGEEITSVVVVAEHDTFGNAVREDVVDAVGQDGTGDAGHTADRSQPRTRKTACGSSVPLFSHADASPTPTSRAWPWTWLRRTWPRPEAAAPRLPRALLG
jgi:hypothetical protein